MMKKTKIICTLGPSSETPEKLEAMLRAGMNVARLIFLTVLMKSTVNGSKLFEPPHGR